MTWLRPCPPCGVHPRVSGENSTSFCRADLKKGSSPRERGKLLPGNPGQGPLRIIPARAGKTPRAARFCVRTTDHPRSRGENPQGGALLCAHHGSSPLARGKRVGLLCVPAPIRIIPARAGKTYAAGGFAWAGWDHPRSRGENEWVCCAYQRPYGSSPLARGKPMPQEGLPGQAGIIPARAGKTAYLWICPDAHRDHPRSRGENPT